VRWALCERGVLNLPYAAGAGVRLWNPGVEWAVPELQKVPSVKARLGAHATECEVAY
jgi:hypothetical protein